MNKTVLISILLLTITAAKVSAQTVVVTDDASYITGQASSVLDIKSISKGLLIPRMTTAQRTAVASPAEGLMVYQIDGTKGFYYFTNSAWVPLASGTSTQWTTSGTNIYYNGGNVGIGTTTPATALQIVGTNPLTLTGVQTGATTDSILTIASGTVRKLPYSTITSGTSWSLLGNAGTNYATNFLGTTDNISLRFRTNNTQRMIMDSLGRVGIGTTTPNSVLHVVGTNPLTLNGIQVGATTDSIMTIASGIVRKLSFATVTSGTSWSLSGNAGTNYATNFLGTTDNISLRFRTNNTQQVIIDSLGRVGIGTTTPTSVLHVAGTNPLTLNGIQVGATTDSIMTIASGIVRKLSFATVTSGTSWSLTGNAGTNYATNFLGTTDNISLRFRTNNTQQVIIDSLGRVGIGTTTPTSVLHVAGTNPLTLNGIQVGATTDSIMTIASGTVRKLSFATVTSGTSWSLTGNAGTNYATNFLGTTDNISLRFRTNNTQRVIMDSLGKVGIGTNTPLTALHVVGTNPLTLNGVQTGATTDSILTITSGTVRSLPFATVTSGTSWSLTGNAGTNYATNFLGTTDNTSMHLRTNNIQGIILDSLGNVGIGAAPAFTTGIYQEKLLVNAGTTNSYNAIVTRGSVNNYFQINTQNLSNGVNASSDLVATADNGTENVNYVDLGINSSGNTQNIFGSPDDAYLYSTGNNFLIGNGSAGQSLVFMTGGTTQSTNERMRINGSGNVGIGTTNPATALHVFGTNPLTLTGVQVGATTDSILTIASGTVRKLAFATVSSGASWSLTGNAGTSNTTNFLGTTDNVSLRIRTNNTQRMIVDSIGNVGVGKATTAYKVDVKGRGNFDSTVNSTNYTTTLQILTYGSTITWDQTKGATATVTLTGNGALSVTNAVAGMYGLIKVVQDATGSRTLTLPSGSKVINGGSGAVILTTAANAIDVLSYFYDGTNYFWTVGYNYN